MKCTTLICTTLASTLMIAAGCKKASEAKPADSTAKPAAAATAKTAKAVAPEAAKDPNEVVASVNDAKYLRKDMSKVVDALLKVQNVPAEQKDEARKYFEQRAVYSFVMKTLILDTAKKQGITVAEADRKAADDKAAADKKASDDKAAADKADRRSEAGDRKTVEDLERVTAERDVVRAERDSLQGQVSTITAERDAAVKDRDAHKAEVDRLAKLVGKTSTPPSGGGGGKGKQTTNGQTETVGQVAVDKAFGYKQH